MAKYDWVALKKEFILSSYKTLKEFALFKNMKYDATFRKRASGWIEEKKQKDNKKTTQVIEKTIEKVAEKEADRNARILTLSDKLADKIEHAIEQLEQYVVTNKVKTKTVEYSNELKPTKEVTVEEEVKAIVDGIIDKQGLKTLTAALKDIKDINTNKQVIETNLNTEEKFDINIKVIE